MAIDRSTSGDERPEGARFPMSFTSASLLVASQGPRRLGAGGTLLRQTLLGRCSELERAAELAREFGEMVRNRLDGEWDEWIARIQDPATSRELRSFAEGLKQDEKAVRAALSLEWSNGQVEGQINKLKRRSVRCTAEPGSPYSVAASFRLADRVFEGPTMMRLSGDAALPSYSRRPSQLPITMPSS